MRQKCVACETKYDSQQSVCPNCDSKTFVIVCDAALAFLRERRNSYEGRAAVGHVDKGAVYFQNGNLQSAKAEFEKAAELDANSAVIEGTAEFLEQARLSQKVSKEQKLTKRFKWLFSNTRNFPQRVGIMDCFCITLYWALCSVNVFSFLFALLI